MFKSTISIFGNKIFFQIINEIELFSKFNLKFYTDIDLCIYDSKKKNLVSVFFIQNKHKNSLILDIKNDFPTLIIADLKTLKNISAINLREKLSIPFTILDFEKKIISLIAKTKFKMNSLIKLQDYIIDKNERKIKKNNLELKLSEKEINFLILFSKYKNSISRNFVLKNAWFYSSETETHTVETHIHRLRKKIFQKFGDKNFIKNNDKGYFI